MEYVAQTFKLHKTMRELGSYRYFDLMQVKMSQEYLNFVDNNICTPLAAQYDCLCGP